MPFFCEFPVENPQQAHAQEDGADDDMGAVKARCHEEGCTVDVSREAEARVRVFVNLHDGEEHAEKYGQDKPPLEAVSIVVLEGVVRPGHRRSRCQQDDRVDQGQMPRVEGFDSVGGPVPAGKGRALELDGLAGEHARVEVGPEPCEKEHDFGGDEKNHSVPHVDLNDGRVVALSAFADDVAPPSQHGVQGDGRADDERPVCSSVHDHHESDGEDERAGCADDRPCARLDQVIIVFL